MMTPSTGPVMFDGAMIVLNVGGKPRFMSYMNHWVLIYDGTIRVMDKVGGTVAILSMYNVFGVFKSTSELIKAWAINSGVPDEPDSSVTDKREDAVPDV
jgi:hypothetical protein